MLVTIAVLCLFGHLAEKAKYLFGSRFWPLPVDYVYTSRTLLYFSLLWVKCNVCFWCYECCLLRVLMAIKPMYKSVFTFNWSLLEVGFFHNNRDMESDELKQVLLTSRLTQMFVLAQLVACAELLGLVLMTLQLIAFWFLLYSFVYLTALFGLNELIVWFKLVWGWYECKTCR